MENKKKFPKERLVSIRAKTGMNQDKFAEHVGLPERTYQAIERGVTADPGISTVAKIAEAEGLSLDFLYYGKEVPQSKSDLVVAVITGLPALNEDQLRTILRTVERFAAGKTTSSTKAAD